MPKKIILLINTGTPTDAHPEAIRKYLKEFLMDKNVVSIPYLMRYILVNGIIVPFRTKYSTEKYKQIFENGTSPLLTHTQQLTKALNDLSSTHPIYFGMRYGEPRAEDTVKLLSELHDGIDEVLLVPLFAHKTKSSFGTATSHFEQLFNRHFPKSRIKVIPPFFEHPTYINALRRKIEQSMVHKTAKIIFSFHGIPISHLYEHHLDKNFILQKEKCCINSPKMQQECYQYQCYKTANRVAAAMELEKDEWEVMFQSRLGRQQWLQPYTAERLAQLPKEGVKSIAIIVPSFLTDCLETLEEIAIEGKKIFMDAGGKSYQYIHCLNTDKDWVDDFLSIIHEQL